MPGPGSSSGGRTPAPTGYPDPYAPDAFPHARYDSAPYAAQTYGDGPPNEPLEFPPFPEQAAAPGAAAPPAPPSAPSAPPAPGPDPAGPAAPAGGAPGAPPAQPGVRLSTDAEATARLRIKLPSVKPQPSTTLRPHASWESREEDQSAMPEGAPRPRLAVNEAAEFARHRASPARTTFLPSELAALTTATLVVPLPPDARPTSALVTTTLPPNMAAQANAALLADAFQDTMEEIFGIDFDAVSRAEVGLGENEDGRAADRTAAAGWLMESFGAPAGGAAGTGLGADADADPLFGPDPVFGSGPAAPAGPAPLPALSPSTDFGGRYGVPTQPASFRSMSGGGQTSQDPARHALALRYLGGIFHDSTGESAYLESAAAGGPGADAAAGAAGAGTGALTMFGAADAPTEQFTRIRAAEPPRRPRPQLEHGRPRPDRPRGSEPSRAAGSPDGPPPAATPSVPRPRRAQEAPRRPAEPPAKPATSAKPANRNEPARRSRTLTVLVLLAAGFAALYGIALIVAGGVLGGTLPSGTVVSGIQIGGLSPAAARTALYGGLGPVADRPIQVQIGDTAAVVQPTAAGLSFDADATISQATRGRTNPFVVIPALFGAGSRIAPVTAVNSAALTRSLNTLAGTYDIPMVEGEITFTNGHPVVIEPKEGRGFSVPSAYTLITTAYLHTSAPIVFPVQDLEPKATAASLQDALDNIGRPAVSGPVTVTTGTVSTVFSATQIGNATVIAPNATGDLIPQINGAMLRADLSPRALAQEQPAVNAAFTIDDNSPVLIPDHEGVGFAPAALAHALLPALTEPSPRAITLQAGDLPPAFTTADAQSLGVTDVLGTSTRQVAAQAGATTIQATELDTNVARAAALINGSVVQPGATFSYLQRIGAPYSANGFTVPAAAQKLGVDPSGGIDTVATALFNAAFSAGMGDAVHHPNASYQDGNPVGLDAAVVYSSTDLQWTDTGTHPVYVYASYIGGELTVAVLGEKSYDQVTIHVSDRTSVVPATSARGGSECAPILAEPGFQVEVTRTLMRAGSQVGSEQFHVTYVAHNGVSCGTSDPATPDQGATPGSTPAKSSGPGTGTGSGGGTGNGNGGGTGAPPSPPAPTTAPTSPSGTLGGLFH